MALRVMRIFIETIMNHKIHFITRPSINRSSVRAKEVLLQTAAKIETLVTTLDWIPRGIMFSTGTSHSCRPVPRATFTEERIWDTRRATYANISFESSIVTDVEGLDSTYPRHQQDIVVPPQPTVGNKLAKKS